MRADPHRAALFRGAASDGGARRAAADGRRRPLPAAPRRGAGGALDPLPHAGLLPAYRCGGERGGDAARSDPGRSEEHTSELQSLMRISYAVFCMKKTNTHNNFHTTIDDHKPIHITYQYTQRGR